MLKIKLFDPKQPINSQELELAETNLNNGGCTVGSSSTCELVLSSTKVKDIHGKFFSENDTYYFRDMTQEGNYQFNDETVKVDHPYSLETDDIIRIGEFVLIVEGPPRKRKPKRRISKPKGAKSSANKSSGNGKRSRPSMQSLKASGKKNRRNQPTSANPSSVSSNAKTATCKTVASPTPTTLPTPTTPLPQGFFSSLPLPAASKSSPTHASRVTSQPSSLHAPDGVKWWTKGELTVRCIEVIDDTVDVKTFRFVGTTPVLFNYKPGQLVTR